MKELLNQLTNTPSSPLVHITNKKRKQMMQSPSRQLLQFQTDSNDSEVMLPKISNQKANYQTSVISSSNFKNSIRLQLQVPKSRKDLKNINSQL